MNATPRCDELAREHQRIMAGPSNLGVAVDWIRLAQELERDLAERTAELMAAIHHLPGEVLCGDLQRAKREYQAWRANPPLPAVPSQEPKT